MTCKKAKAGVKAFLRARAFGSPVEKWCEECRGQISREENPCEVIQMLRRWGMCHWDKNKNMEQMTTLGAELESCFLDGNEFEADLKLLVIKEKLDESS